MRSASPTLTGRDDHLQVVSAAIAAGRSCLIRGEPGIGKSALLRAALASSERQARVGRAFELLAGEPYFALRDALGRAFEGEPPAVVPLARQELDRAVLVIEDLHWCDRDTLEVLNELSAVVPLIATVRIDPANAAALCARMSGLGDVVELEPLDDASIRTILTALRPGAPASDLSTWTRDSAGVPLIAELAAISATSPLHSGETLLDAMLGRVDPEELDVLTRLALHGSPLILTEAEAATLHSDALVVETTPGCYRCRHDLVATAVLRRVDRTQQATIHAALSKMTADESRRAFHLAKAGDPNAPVAARAAATRAPTAAARANLLVLAIESSTTEDLALRLEAAEAAQHAGRYRDAIALLEHAEISDPDNALRRDVVLANSYWTEAMMPETRAVLQRARERIGDATTPELVELLTIEVRIRARIDWDSPGAIALGEQTVDLAMRLQHGEGQARSALGLAYLMAGDERWLAEMERTGELAREAEDLHAATVAFDTVLFGNLMSGDPHKCRPLAEQMISATELASPAWNGYFRAAALLAGLHIEGDYAAVIDQAPGLLDRPLTVRSREMATWTLALAYADVGRDADALATATRAVDDASDDGARSSALCALAETHWLAGRNEAALAAATEAAALPVVGFPGHVLAALAGAWASFDLGYPIRASLLAALDAAPPNLRGARLEANALECDDPRQASAELERAAEAWRAASVRERARASWGAGEAAAVAGDTLRASAFLDGADVIAQTHGMRALQHRIDRTRHRSGLPRATRGADGDLSRRQQDVLQRVAAGATTAEIAQALGVSPATVETHVRAALRLTGALTRRQASAEAGATRFVGALVCDRAEDLQYAAAQYAFGAHRGTMPIGALPDEPWRVSAGDTTTVVAEVNDDAGAARVLLARLRGARVVVAVCDPARSALLIEGLTRVGHVRRFDPKHEPVDALSPEEHRILAEFTAGASAENVAESIGYSRRSVARRLSAIRSKLDTSSTAVAVTRWRATTGTSTDEELFRDRY